MGKNKAAKPAGANLKGPQGFDSYYRNLYGDRWDSLKNALFQENVYAQFNAGGKDSYFLDPASVFAAMQIDSEGSRYLDMCAAPGGKTLIIAGRMNQDAVLVSNERSPARKQRLCQVVADCLPESINSRIKISCSDAAAWCTTQTECYDRILLDAPCSSERHVLNDEKYLAEWSPSRIKSLAMEQWALLSCAYRLLEPDGYLVYSTCALASAENDEVVRRLFKKFDDCELVFVNENPVVQEDFSKIVKMDFIPEPERTEFGFHILPDTQKGCGPIWFSVIHKKAAKLDT